MTDSVDFKSSQQVICLEHKNCRLYASIIQFIKLQQTYWIRPLFLVEHSPTKPRIVSLHPTSDVIVPKGSFREVWDTEILEFWTELYDDSNIYNDNLAGRKELQRFLRAVFPS